MTMSASLLTDCFERISELVHQTVKELTPEQLSTQIAPDANTIGWLVWHLSRGQDSQLSEVAGEEQVWTSDSWCDRFGLPFDPEATGYGQSIDEVAAVQGINSAQLAGYFDAVHKQTLGFVASVSDADLERVVDAHWDPPVTLAARLISVIAEDLQHVGQAAFIRGLL